MSDSLLLGPPLDWALRYIKLGWFVFPVEGKLPLVKEWQIAATINERQVRAWWGRWPKANIGIRTGDAFFMYDFDVKDGGEESHDFLRSQYGPFPSTLQQVTGTGGGHLLFRMPDFPVRNYASKSAKDPLFGPGIDIRGVGGFMVACPSIHPDTGRHYYWDGSEEIEQEPIAEAPKWLLDKLRFRTAAPADSKAAPPIAERIHKGEGRHAMLVSIAGSMRRRGLSGAEMYPALMAVNLARCEPPYDDAHVRQIAHSMEKYPAGKPYLPRAQSASPPPPLTDNDEIPLNAEDVEAAAKKTIDDDDLRAALLLAPEIAKLLPIYQLVVVAKLKDHFKKRWPARDFDKLLREAAKAAGRPFGQPDAAAPDDDSGESGPKLDWQPMTDAGNGERLALLFGSEIRYCVDFKRWLVWDGTRWAVDEFGVMLQKFKQLAREMYRQAINPDNQNPKLRAHARESESLGSAKRALEYAATEKGVPIQAADLDQHPFLWNCMNGVLDLRDLTLMPHDRKFLLTKLCPVEYSSDAKAPRFLNFIQRAMGCVNEEAELTERTRHLIGFIQRALGYSLTGDVSEKVLFVLHGPQGNNGKTTLLTMFRELMGNDYAGQVLIDTMMNARSGADSTARADLADLRGRRLIITSEVNKEHRLDEGKIKYITAGMASPIKCKRLYENPFEFIPTHKMFMDCNHLPRIGGTDNAIWKRLKLIPFDVSIPDDEIDTDLPDKLRREFPGILAWAARGCADWFKKGLGAPPEVAKANQEWREHDDALKEFLDDYCEIDKGDKDMYGPARDLYAAYLRWAKEAGEKYPMGREGFNDRLTAKGLKQSRHRKWGDPPKQTRCWEGLKLRPEISLLVSGRAALSE